MSQNILEIPFWKVSLRFIISFLILLTFVLSAVTYFKNGDFHEISEGLKDGSWVKFITIRIALAIVYGVSMAYFSRKKAKNNLRK